MSLQNTNIWPSQHGYEPCSYNNMGFHTQNSYANQPMPVLMNLAKQNLHQNKLNLLSEVDNLLTELDKRVDDLLLYINKQIFDKQEAKDELKACRDKLQNAKNYLIHELSSFEIQKIPLMLEIQTKQSDLITKLYMVVVRLKGAVDFEALEENAESDHNEMMNEIQKCGSSVSQDSFDIETSVTNHDLI